jgi:hypothetical protein
VAKAGRYAARRSSQEQHVERGAAALCPIWAINEEGNIMTTKDDIQLHDLELIEGNLETERESESAEAAVVDAGSGFMINSASGFMINSASGFMIN